MERQTEASQTYDLGLIEKIRERAEFRKALGRGRDVPGKETCLVGH